LRLSLLFISFLFYFSPLTKITSLSYIHDNQLTILTATLSASHRKTRADITARNEPARPDNVGPICRFVCLGHCRCGEIKLCVCKQYDRHVAGLLLQPPVTQQQVKDRSHQIGADAAVVRDPDSCPPDSSPDIFLWILPSPSVNSGHPPPFRNE